MKNEIGVRIFNIFLRGLSIVSRFVLIYTLAKLLEPDQLGVFGLILATVSFNVLVVGADFYTYSQRELLSCGPERRSFIIQHQLIAHVILYLVLIPLQILLFVFDLLPIRFFIWFFALLIVEHVAQELNRLLVVLHRQIAASWVLFLRTGVWVWGILPLMWFIPGYNRIETVFMGWFIGGIIAIAIGIFTVKKEVLIWKKWPLDKVWIKKGFHVGAGFLLATICFKALLTLDRYVVEYLTDTSVLGVYVFYIGIVMGAMGPGDISS